MGLGLEVLEKYKELVIVHDNVTKIRARRNFGNLQGTDSENQDKRQGRGQGSFKSWEDGVREQNSEKIEEESRGKFP